VRDDLGIAGGGKLPAAAPQLVAQFDVVVNLAILHDGNRAVVHGDRLVSSGDVDDAEPRRSQRGRRVAERPAVIRAAMP